MQVSLSNWIWRYALDLNLDHGYSLCFHHIERITVHAGATHYRLPNATGSKLASSQNPEDYFWITPGAPNYLVFLRSYAVEGRVRIRFRPHKRAGAGRRGLFLRSSHAPRAATARSGSCLCGREDWVRGSIAPISRRFLRTVLGCRCKPWVARAVDRVRELHTGGRRRGTAPAYRVQRLQTPGLPLPDPVPHRGRAHLQRHGQAGYSPPLGRKQTHFHTVPLRGP